MDKTHLYQDLLQEERELEQALNGLREYLKYLKKSNEAKLLNTPQKVESQIGDSFTIPKTFNKALTIPEKVLFALNNLNSGTRSEIAQKMLEIEPDFKGGIDKAKLDAGNWCSKLSSKRYGIVKVLTLGTGRAPSVYTLK